MMQVKNKIALSQKNSLVIKGGSSFNPKHVLALMAEVSFLGFKFDKKLLEVLKTCSQSKLREIRTFLMGQLSVMVGNHVRYTPLFKNFPDDVPDDDIYFFKRVVGFIDNFLEITDENDVNAMKLSCGCIVNKELFDVDLFGACPICQRQHDGVNLPVKRKKLTEKTELKTLKLMTEEEFSSLVKNLLSANSSYSPKTKEDVKLCFDLYGKDIINFYPEEITIKENLAYVGSLIVNNKDLSLNSNWFKTSTDVLRLAVALSVGDVSLKEDSKFKINNRGRKIVMKFLNQLENPLEDMLRYRQKWLRLGEYLHLGAYRLKYEKAFNNMQILRENHSSIETFNKKAHAAVLNTINSGKALDAVEVLSVRPGEFTRKLDLMLRETKDDVVLEKFSKIVSKVATPLLLKLHQYLTSRFEKSEFRYFTPKGQIAKLFFMEIDKRKVLSKDQINTAQEIIKTELKHRFKGEKLSVVYIDPALKGLIVPLNLRSSSKSLFTVARGSKVAYNVNAKTIRMFIYWKENEKSDRIDVDLSAAGYDKNWQYVTHLSWTSLQSLDCVHSGDIQSAPNGASEFIDINVESLLNNNIRYVTMNVYSWTGQSFKDYEIFAGVMERKSSKKGEVYEPKTVKNKFDVTGDASAAMPLILDLKTGEIIWCDFTLGKGSGRRVEANNKQIAAVGKSTVNMNKTFPNLFDLFSLHAKARGAKIDVVKKVGIKYDLEFDMDKAKDVAEILAKYVI